MRLFILILLLLILITFVNATTYQEEFNIINKQSEINILINFDNKQAFNFYLDIPNDINEVKVLIDNQEKHFEVIKSQFGNTVNLNGNGKEIKINYLTKTYIEETSKNYFTSEITSLLDSNLNIKVNLPEGASLDKSFNNDLKSTSAYPTPDKISTNGKNIIIEWNYNAKKDQKFPLFIIYNIPKSNYFYLILIIILILALTIFLIKKRSKVEIKTVKIKVDNVEEHLKDEEKVIVNILKQKKGECTQSTLVTLTGMSKASLSRLLNELESRNIILKEQKGNKNLIILKRR